MDSTLYLAAISAHEANRAFGSQHGLRLYRWELTLEATKKRYLKAVKAILDNPDMTPEMSHKVWLKERKAAGWTKGAEWSSTKKTHPAMVPFAKLSEFEKAKCVLFVAIVKAVLSLRY